MEPRPEGRGDKNPAYDWPTQLVLQWSHGPKAVETGTLPPGECTTNLLQWSHGPKAVETNPHDVSGTLFDLLQWSHGPKAVETRRSPLADVRTPARFNGATARRPWRPLFEEDALMKS